MISDQNCTPLNSAATLYYSHFVIAEFSQYKYFMDQVAIMLKSGNKILYSKQKCRDIGQKRCDSHRGRGTPL